MIRLWDIYEVMLQDSIEDIDGPLETERILYDLLVERPAEANISHSKVPAMADHCAFVRGVPYKKWYLIQDWPGTYEAAVFEKHKPHWVGSIYITHQREVGIAIFKGYQGEGFGSEAVKMLMIEHPGKLYANISPHNPASVKFFKQFGAKHIQNTYEIGG